jgi:NTP pyrophosphatase (non-canonical NTP hydrolase)
VIDVLDHIIERQKEVKKYMDMHRYEFRDRRDMIMSYMAYIVGETDEVNRCINYKYWKRPEKEDECKIKEELGDIFLMWLDLIIRLGFDQEIFDVIYEKQAHNIQRQLGKIEGREDYKPNN